MLELAGLLPQSKAHCRYSASFGSVGCSLPIHAAKAVKLVSYALRVFGASAANTIPALILPMAALLGKDLSD